MERIRKEVQKVFSLSPELHQRERERENSEREKKKDRKRQKNSKRGRERRKESGQRKNRKIIVWLLRTNPCLHKEVGVLL